MKCLSNVLIPNWPTGLACVKRRVSLPNPPLSSRGWDRFDISMRARVLKKLEVLVEFQTSMLNHNKDVRNPKQGRKNAIAACALLLSSLHRHCHRAPLLRIFMEKEELSRYSITADVNGRAAAAAEAAMPRVDLNSVRG